ncbi:pimeloyl-ACP methyl ester esterase BioH [Alteromonas ponticola]|uniref:Pimeloyl-[acyl-carrier protein] methyl ester esterase n=1 Tax=Alteromonas aquimaris TaxID=2998417 RepID=A0ABT3P8C0_9ALTE|nr:pimeloyl-ACP methyl ester esterase BioH [Alteromonas aquimaris]MCW8109007.1 pimeloyl-ACP methyl ester esterase BioH [Alteromonas aquimaris]
MLDSHKRSGLITRSVGTGKELIFLHGWGMNGGAFSQLFPYLQNDFTLTVIDLPGFGENSHIVPEPFSLPALADLIASQLSERSVLVGWSLGGLIAQYLALQHEHTITGLITIASSPKFEQASGWPGIDAELLTQFQQQLSTDYKKTIERFLAIQAMGSATARQDIKAIRQAIHEYPEPAQKALAEGLRLLSTEDLRQDINRIKQPTLRLYGRLDSLVPPSSVDQICKLHPQADSVVLPHASHAPFISHPQQTADIIRHFVMTQLT